MKNKNSYKNVGYQVFEKSERELRFIDWEKLCLTIPYTSDKYELVELGDTQEKAFVNVCRLLQDGNPPKSLNKDIGDNIFKIVSSKEAFDFYEKITGIKGLYVRRSQINTLPEQGYIGYHIDSESNTNYKVAVIFLVKPSVSGGDFIIYPKLEKPINLRNFDLIILDTKIPHEVLKVRKGSRISLVLWLANA